MPSIEDFTHPLWQGVREVYVPKDKVTELSPGWYRSRYNLPHKGSRSAWRNGRLHAHEMKDHWAVHLDRVDPKKHSMGHLIADAPLLMFMWSGFLSSMLKAKEELESSIGIGIERCHELTKLDGLRTLGGLLLVFVGTFVALDPDLELFTILILIPLIIIILGAFIIFDALAGMGDGKIVRSFGGVAMISFGSIGIMIEELIFLLLLIFLMFWTVASGVYYLVMRREIANSARDRYAPVVLGLLSLGLGVFLIVDLPDALDLLLRGIGVLAILAGAMQTMAGVCAWNRTKRPT